MAENTHQPSAAGRRLCFLMSKWAHPTSVLAWAWLRQYYIHRDSDTLYIVHTGKDDNWKAGGPLGPDLDTALQAWPHTVESLHGGVGGLTALLERLKIDVVVLGEDSVPRQAGMMTRTSDWVKVNIRVPFIIIRPSAVRNDRLRISSSPLHPDSPGKDPASAPGRTVAIAYPNATIGRHLVERAKQLALLPQDEIFVVHSSTQEPRILRQTRTLLRRTVTMGGGGGGEAPARAASAPAEAVEGAATVVGGRELDGYSAHLDVVLKGDPRQSVQAFCESEGVELLVISTRTGGRIRKTLGGGSVSGYLIDHAPCPCLVIPYKALGLQAEEEAALSPRAELAGLDSVRSSGFGRALSGADHAAEAKVAALQAQLVERDAAIAELREEVRRLRLVAAEVGDVTAHDPAAAAKTY